MKEETPDPHKLIVNVSIALMTATLVFVLQIFIRFFGNVGTNNNDKQ